MQDPPAQWEEGGEVAGRADLAGTAHLELAQGVRHLHLEEAMFEAMLRGWRAQQTARMLRDKTIADRELVIRRFAAFTNEYPWAWQAAHLEEWVTKLVGERGLAHATVRVYQVALRLFTEYLADPRYGWAAECQARFGTHPVRICHEWNTVSHASDYEGRPGQASVHPGGAAGVVRLRRRPGPGGVDAQAQGRPGRLPGRDRAQGAVCPGGCGAGRRSCSTPSTSAATRPRRSSAASAAKCALRQGGAGPASAAAQRL
jgi:hypothetical protein